MVRGMSAHGVRPCPVYFSARDKLPGASCYLRVYTVYVYDYTNNNIIIIMCIGLVHGIFMGNIYLVKV